MFASQWIGVIANQDVFSLIAPVGSIIDLDMSVALANNATAATLTVAAGTLGRLYYGPLDGASDVYTPVSLATTT